MARTRAQSYDPYSDWGTNSKGQQVNAMGQRKTIGYSPDRIPARGFGGLNEHYIRNSYDGTPKAIDAAAQEARKAGALIDRNGQRMADTWENRGFKTHLSDKNPYAQPAGPVPPPAVPSLPPGAPSADNRAFAEKGAPKGGGGGGGVAPVAPGGGGNDDPGSDEAPAEEPTGGGEEGSDEGGGGGGGGEPAPPPPEDPNKIPLLKVPLPTPNRALIPPAPPPMGNDNSGQAAPGYQGIADSGWGQSAAESAMQSKPSPQPASNRASTNPYMSRADNVAKAKADGSFGGIRDQYNKGFGDTASWMDAKGDISTDQGVMGAINRAKLQPVADEIAARRDFDRGEAPVMFTDPNESPTADEMNPQPRRAVKANPYGTATATFGGPPTTGGTMEDPLTGATVPIKQWTNDQSAVQATKYGPGAAQAGENYFGPKKTQGQVDANRYVDTAISAVPLGQDDAEQYRAIARGGKIPRSPKA